MIVNAFPDIDLDPYEGERIIILNDKVVAHEKNLLKLEDAINDSKETPTVAFIPEEDIECSYHIKHFECITI